MQSEVPGDLIASGKKKGILSGVVTNQEDMGKKCTYIVIDMYVFLIKHRQQKVVNVGDNFGHR